MEEKSGQSRTKKVPVAKRTNLVKEKGVPPVETVNEKDVVPEVIAEEAISPAAEGVSVQIQDIGETQVAVKTEKTDKKKSKKEKKKSKAKKEKKKDKLKKAKRKAKKKDRKKKARQKLKEKKAKAKAKKKKSPKKK